MKKFVVLSMLMIGSCVYGMDEYAVITKPYEPSFGARHPHLMQGVKATGVLAGTSLAVIGLQALLIRMRGQADHCHYNGECNICIPKSSDPTNPYKTMIPACAAAAVSIIRQPYKRNLIDALLTDPHYALTCMSSIREKFNLEVSKTLSDAPSNANEENLTVYTSLVKKFEKKCPVFLLDECSLEDNGKPCLFSRAQHPHYRAEFEKNVISASTKLLQDKKSNDLINITSFGSGKCFQELVIVARMLAKNPDAKIDIHLIDKTYQPCVDDSNEAETYTTICFRINQMSRWIARTFPEAQLSVIRHACVKDYYEYLSRERRVYPDVIMAVDIPSDSNSTTEYVNLCTTALDAKMGSTNILLAKNADDMDGHFTQITSDPLSQSMFNNACLSASGMTRTYIQTQPCAPAKFHIF